MNSKVGKEKRGHCPNCGPNKWATIKGHFQHAYDHDEAPMSVHGEWYLLFCHACKDAYMLSEPSYSEWVPVDEHDHAEHTWEGIPTQWPKPYSWQRPSWLPVLETRDSRLHSLVNELYTALDSDLKILASIAMRTVFECTAEMLGAEPTDSFSKKLAALMSRGYLGEHEHSLLSKLTEAGNASAHRGWTPSFEELQEMMSILSPFLERSLIVGSSKFSPPPRPKKVAS